MPTPSTNPHKPISVLDLDDPKEQEKLKVASEAIWKYDHLEEHLRVVVGLDFYTTINVTELCSVLNVVIPPKLKVLNFEKYDGMKCPMAHFTMYYQWMAAYTQNDKLLVHYFQDSLTKLAVRWYVKLDRNRIQSWKDLARAL